MGCGSSSLKGNSDPAGGSKEDKERSYAIDKQIDDDAKKLRRECKILLLGMFSSCYSPVLYHYILTIEWTGSGESGKSTIVKQMKLIYQNGYSRDEMMLFRLTIHKSTRYNTPPATLCMPSDETPLEQISLIQLKDLFWRWGDSKWSRQKKSIRCVVSPCESTWQPESDSNRSFNHRNTRNWSWSTD